MADVEKQNFNEDMDSIARQIKQYNCTPILGNQLALDMLFGRDIVVPAWAADLNYPLAERNNVARIAQFQSVEKGNLLDAKTDYLRFLNSKYFDIQRAGPREASLPPVDWDLVSEQAKSATFTELVIDHLHHPTFAPPPKEGQTKLNWDDNPFNVLAAIKQFTVYITTSHHRFLERALANVRRPANTQTYCWTDEVEIPPEWAVDPKVKPSVENPLVYHLFGIEDRDASLVLTEDDHLEFLLKAYPGFMNHEKTPNPVRDAITRRVLLLIGYEIDGWDLRALLKGLITRIERSPIQSVAIQIDPKDSDRGLVLDPAIYRRYLSNSFHQVKFKVIWAPPNIFMSELWKRLN